MATTINKAHTTSASTIMTETSSTAMDDEQITGSSSSSTVSQSPLQRGDDENSNINQSCHNKNDESNAPTTNNPQRQQNSSVNTNAVINPYKKQAVESPSKNNNNRHPNHTKRSQFIEKYRLQSVHNRQRAIAAGHTSASVVTPNSALEMLQLNQEWRQNWRQRRKNDDGAMSTNSSDNHENGYCNIALRPRLFLFQRMMQPQVVKSESGDSMTTQSQKQQHCQGVWELGTGITELSGEGGSGKTQMCLSLCLTCAMTPLLFSDRIDESIQSSNNDNNNHNDQPHYTSLYISMGGGIPQSKLASRLRQMLEHRQQHELTPENVEDILSRIWLLSLKNEDDFIDFVQVHLPNILNNQLHGAKPRQYQQSPHCTNNDYPTCDKIGFIAFDGIANFFRFSDPLFQQYHSNYNSNQQRSVFHRDRSSKLFHLSSLLRRMSDLYDVSIVVTNQVKMSVPSDDGLLKQQPPSSSTAAAAISRVGGDNAIQPALGLIWSNCVTTRYMLHRKDGLMANISTTSYGNGNNEKGDSSSERTGTNVNKKTEIIRRQRVRKACVLQSVCTPVESEVWYFIDTGAVVAVS